jgi:hypothetical protein
VAEYKYDGMRAQLHLLASGDVRVYSRNCEDRTASFPDVVALVKALLGDDCVETEGGQSRTLIADAELVAVDAKTGRLRAFQELATRKRGETTVAEVTVQVCVFAFDLLMLDGEVLATQPFRCRRARLRQLVEARADASRLRLACALELTPEQTDDADDAGVSGQPPASVGEEAEDRSAAEIGVAVEVTEERGSTSERLHRFLLASLAAGCEGLMLKTLEGVYEPGKRADTWLKMKKVRPVCSRACRLRVLVFHLLRGPSNDLYSALARDLGPPAKTQDYVEGMADSLDLVVIGAWYGDGRKTVRSSPFSRHEAKPSPVAFPPSLDTPPLNRSAPWSSAPWSSAPSLHGSISMMRVPPVSSHAHAGVVLAVPHGMLERGDGGVPVHVPLHVGLHGRVLPANVRCAATAPAAQQARLLQHSREPQRVVCAHAGMGDPRRGLHRLANAHGSVRPRACRPRRVASFPALPARQRRQGKRRPTLAEVTQH